MSKSKSKISDRPKSNEVTAEKPRRMILQRMWKPVLTLLLGLAAFLFWGRLYPHALAFQEQTQLFLFDDDYLLSRLAEPGGVARYVAEFLTQFYNLVSVGAIVVALLYMLMQQLVWRLMHPAADCWYPLSFIPALMTWMLMGDVNVMLSFVVALILALVAMLCLPKGKWGKKAFVIFGIPIIYWIVGPLVFLVALYVALRQQKSLKGIGFGVATVVYAIACVVVSGFLLPYPLQRLFLGMSYYRYPVVIPKLMVAMAVITVMLIVGGRWLPCFSRSRNRLLVLGGGALILLVMAIVLPMCYEQRKYDVMEYDYLVRLNRWDDIIAKSEQRQPDLPMSVCATNLALGMKGQLGDRAFEFYQHGVGGLLPKLERNYATLHLTSEAYFHLGLVNTSQRFSFEAMEALPNYNKSARSVKRLVETNLINGQYDVAEKYLRMLEKTIFYKKWAERIRPLLRNEKLINDHPLYGKLRKLRLQDDFLFSEQELDKICGQLFIHDNTNSLAKQYLLIYPLLEGDFNKFMEYLPVVQNKVNYNPHVCQEALAYVFMRNNQMPPQNLVSPAVTQQLSQFVNAYKSSGGKKESVEAFKKTVWYYLTVQE